MNCIDSSIRTAVAFLLGVTMIAAAGDWTIDGNLTVKGSIVSNIGTKISSIPITITSPGYYYFTQNLTLTTNAAAAISVAANDVTINMNGFVLDGGGANYPLIDGISASGGGYNNLTVNNGTIRSFKNGIYSVDSLTQVYNVRVIGNIQDGIKLLGAGAIVSNCIAQNNGNEGINIISSGIITGSIASGNMDGIYAAHSVVKNCVARGNMEYGIWVSSCNTIDNEVNYNGVFGIYSVGSKIEHNNVAYNNTSKNASQGGGILGSVCEITNNYVLGNECCNIWALDRNFILNNNLIGSNIGINFVMTPNYYSQNKCSSSHTPFTPFSGTTGQTDGGGNVSF